MRKAFVGGNWKMNGSMASCESLVTNLKPLVSDLSDVEMVVFPSFVHLSAVSNWLKNSQIGLGAQNQSAEEKGAFTGDTAPGMLTDLGCEYVLLGHSERRHVFGESNELIAKKFALALTNHLKPVLCVGETEAEREAGETDRVVREQVDAIINTSGIDAFKTAVIAYEPVWAIGTGKVAEADDVQNVHEMIRTHLAAHDAEIADGIRIIYGGSVKPGNAAEIFAKADVDGGLIGGASLKAEDFAAICAAAAAIEVA